MQTQQLVNLSCGWQFFEELTVLCRRKLALADTYRPTFADKTILTCQWHTPFLSSIIFSFLFLSFFSSFFFSFSLFSFSFLFPFSLFPFVFLSFSFLSFPILFSFSFPSFLSSPSSFFPFPWICRQQQILPTKLMNGGCHTPTPPPPYRDAPGWIINTMLNAAFLFWWGYDGELKEIQFNMSIPIRQRNFVDHIIRSTFFWCFWPH